SAQIQPGHHVPCGAAGPKPEEILRCRVISKDYSSRPHLGQSDALRRGIPHPTRTHARRGYLEDVGADDAIHRCFSGRTLLLPDLTVGEFGDDVEVSEVAGVLLD